jgi:sterol desaturase/sphingolipid hydroxylase (fatty acid hydroxylase superfamily)
VKTLRHFHQKHWAINWSVSMSIVNRILWGLVFAVGVAAETVFIWTFSSNWDIRGRIALLGSIAVFFVCIVLVVFLEDRDR